MAAQNRNCKVKRLALMGLLFALAMALSFLESLLPALPMLPPGIRLGLSNIVTMYALFALGPVSGYTIAVLKSLFVLLTRGAVAAAMSASGGIASVTVMLLLSLLPGIRRQYLLLSVFGGAAHNVGPVHHQQSICLVLLAGSFSGGTAHGRHHRDGSAGCHALSGPLKPKINN